MGRKQRERKEIPGQLNPGKIQTPDPDHRKPQSGKRGSSTDQEQKINNKSQQQDRRGDTNDRNNEEPVDDRSLGS